jgi:hypothetical protein
MVARNSVGNLSMFTVQQLERIESTWQQDAESEHDDYYFETNEFKAVANGSKAFVISRKGTGKSAIVMHLKATAKHAVDLSLSDLDPEELHGLGGKASQEQKSGHYRNTFAYVIYRAVPTMMLKSEDVSEAAKKQIHNAFPEQAQDELPRNVMRWVKLKGHFQYLEIGVVDQNSGGNLIYLSPGLRLSYDKWSSYLSVGVPIVNAPYGMQPEPSWRIISGVSYAF